MSLKLKTAPAIEPVTFEEAKNFIKVDTGDDNTLISSLISAARESIEKETGQVLITQTWQMFLDYASPEIRIPRPPLQSVSSIKAISTVESYVDLTSAISQAVLSVASTTGFTAGDLIFINRGGAREEEKVILSIQDGVSLTLTANLVYEHTAAQADRVERYELVSAVKYAVDTSGLMGRVKLRMGYIWPDHRGFASFIIEFVAGYGIAATSVPASLRQLILELVSHLYDNRGSKEIPSDIKDQLWRFKVIQI